MISLVNLILNEGREDIVSASSTLPSTLGSVNANLDNFKQVLADALNLDPEEIMVGIVPAKCQDPNQPATAIMDRLNLGKTGDIWARFDVSKGTDEIAQTLNNFRILDDIDINGQSGNDLSGIVSDGTSLAGNLVITSKDTEAELIPFLRAMGALQQADNDGGFEEYWRNIGGKVIGEATVQRMQQQMMISMGIRGGRQLAGGPRGRLLGR